MNSLAKKPPELERQHARSEGEPNVHQNDHELKEFHLVDLGWNSFFENNFVELDDPALLPARVVEQSRGTYRVRGVRQEYAAQIAGKIRYLAQAREDFPAVGDWVAIVPTDEDQARIECILPRKTKLSRKVVGRELSKQIIAANVDTVFVVSSLNREFNLRRIERYLTLVWDSGASPIVLLNKADLCPDAGAHGNEVQNIAPSIPVLLLSALHATGLEPVRNHILRGETAAFVGSSGVGKSTIINALSGKTSLRVQPVREDDDRGLHTTTSRQMIFLPGGGMVIDTPGMRELQLWDSKAGLSRAFEDIEVLSESCKFRNCAHGGEPGCAVEAAILEGQLMPERLESHRCKRSCAFSNARRIRSWRGRKRKDGKKSTKQCVTNTGIDFLYLSLTPALSDHAGLFPRAANPLRYPLRLCRKVFRPRRWGFRSRGNATAPGARCARARTRARLQSDQARICDRHRNRGACSIADPYHPDHAEWWNERNREHVHVHQLRLSQRWD
jgi:ribosome biogenesis GTPase / thiamine phosphate phosphatase